MATETHSHHEVDHHEGHETDQNLWDGSKSPFKVSYGKLMMWYFLVSDAFTFAGFLIAYGTLRFSMPSWPLPDVVFLYIPRWFPSCTFNFCYSNDFYFDTLFCYNGKSSSGRT